MPSLCFSPGGGAVFSHRMHGTHRKFRVRVLPRNTLRRVWHPCHTHAAHLIILPRMRTDAHRWLGCVGFSHGIHGIHRSFWRRISCVRNFCGFCGVCGKIVGRLRGYGRMPYPPTIAQTGVGDSSKKVCGTITFLLLLHQIIRHDTLVYDRLNSIIVNK